MDELVRWLGEQFDEDERIARAAATVAPVLGSEKWRSVEGLPAEGFRYWCITTTPPDHTVTVVELAGSGRSGGGVHEEAVALHIAAHDPARVLREIDVDRALVAAYAQACRRRTEIADEHWGAAGPSGDLSAVARWKEHDAVAEALKPHVLRRAAVYADRPGFREEWRP